MSDKFPYSLVRPLLFSLNPEAAHNVTLPLLRSIAHTGIAQLFSKKITDTRVVMGLPFPNAVGLAAGMDKDGAYIDGLAALGFGYIEVGTVTPRAQPGNPKPRMFRLPQAHALINRMGFNNGGVDAFVRNVQASRYYQERQGILGLNIGKMPTHPLNVLLRITLPALIKFIHTPPTSRSIFPLPTLKTFVSYNSQQSSTACYRN